MNLFFKPITAEQAQHQAQQFAQQSQLSFQEDAAIKARAELLRRGPGRPKRERTVNDALSAAAAASSSASSQQQQQEQNNSIDDEEQASKKAKRVHWFDSPLIHDILHAYKLSGFSARKCVLDLQKKYPALPTETEGRFEYLNESTVRSWFAEDHQLKPQFQRLLKDGEYGAGGHKSVLSGHPVAEEKIKVMLQKLRYDANAGINVTIQSVRWVMTAVIKAECHDVNIKTFALSKPSISRWCKHHMNWSWRRGTSEASKLPVDWQQQGIDMAKRIAVNMHTNEVRNMQCTLFNEVHRKHKFVASI